MDRKLPDVSHGRKESKEVSLGTNPLKGTGHVKVFLDTAS
jgi:hypothetical protein